MNNIGFRVVRNENNSSSRYVVSDTTKNLQTQANNEVLDQAQRDMNNGARPELSSHVENMDQYDTILLGYPNWWATIPMPKASFLE